MTVDWLGRKKIYETTKGNDRVSGRDAFSFRSGAGPRQKAKFEVVCDTTTASTVELFGASGSECFALSDGSGEAKAKASDAHSFADSEMSTGGTTHATATGGAFSGAFADHGGNSKSHVLGGGDGDATSDDNGTAITNATGGSEAHTQAFGKCDAKATSDGAGSFALADCEKDGTFAHATATGGGEARAFFNAPPVCHANGGTAKVRSSGGNCGK